jgi:hypothetical protein
VFISVVVHVISFQNIMCVFVYYLYRLSVLFYITYNSVHVFVHSFSLSYYYSFFYKHDYTMYTATDTYIYTHIYPYEKWIPFALNAANRQVKSLMSILAARLSAYLNPKVDSSFSTPSIISFMLGNGVGTGVLVSARCVR